MDTPTEIQQRLAEVRRLREETLSRLEELDEKYASGALDEQEYQKARHRLTEIVQYCDAERLEKRYRRGMITRADFLRGDHPYSCPRYVELHEAAERDRPPHFEVDWHSISLCPGCGIRIERYNCLEIPDEEDPNVQWCDRWECCCPRCGGQILEVRLIEYEKGCITCGREVGLGGRRRMVHLGNPEYPPRQWQCEDCCRSAGTSGRGIES
jgi:hypothetical protein